MVPSNLGAGTKVVHLKNREIFILNIVEMYNHPTIKNKLFYTVENKHFRWVEQAENLYLTKEEAEKTLNSLEDTFKKQLEENYGLSKEDFLEYLFSTTLSLLADPEGNMNHEYTFVKEMQKKYFPETV